MRWNGGRLAGFCASGGDIFAHMMGQDGICWGRVTFVVQRLYLDVSHVRPEMADFRIKIPGRVAARWISCGAWLPSQECQG